MRRAWDLTKEVVSVLCWIALIAWSLSSIAQVLVFLARSLF